MVDIVIALLFIALGLFFWFKIASDQDEDNYVGLSRLIVSIFGIKGFRFVTRGLGVILAISGMVQLIQLFIA